MHAERHHHHHHSHQGCHEQPRGFSQTGGPQWFYGKCHDTGRMLDDELSGLPE